MNTAGENTPDANFVGANNHSPQPAQETPSQKYRQPTRLQYYDYAKMGGYFITICTHNRECLFGAIVADKMHLTALGKMVEQCWQEIPLHFPHVTLQAFVIMPNHIHGILTIVVDGGKPAVRADNHSPQSSSRPRGTAKTLGSIIRGFKIGVTKFARRQEGETQACEMQSGKSKAGERFFAPTVNTAPTIWQRNYYEHVIRNEADYTRIAEYIIDNPRRWAEDSLHPDFVAPENAGRRS
jgi:putative transposase